MRILLVSANFRPSVGGIERYVELLGRGLVGRGLEVTVLCCRHDRAPRVEQDGGLRVVRVPASYALKRLSNLHYPLPAPARFLRELRRLASWADVVHAHDALYLTSAAALVLARRTGTPSVLTQHVSFTPQGSRVLDSAERAAVATVGRSARLASRVLAYNAAVAAWAESTWRLGPIPLLPAGVPEPEAELTSGDRAALRRELSLPEDRFLALFVGRDVPTKRLALFLASTDPAYELVAVTDRPSSAAPAGVWMLPFMTPERLQRLLLSVDAFVLPSKAEGFPLSLQEALLAGLPCVVTRVPGFDRYLREDEVLWIDPTPESIRSALLRLASEPDTRSAFAANAKTAGRREFGLDRFVGAHVELYADVLRAAGDVSRRDRARVSR